MPTGSHAVFLSYASEDAPAAQRIAEALRAAGLEVWFDREELRGGDVWDQKIRREIHDCVLFIPIVSQHTQERLEGYFRHEWKLATERIHHMAEEKPFLVPVVVDGTRDQEAFVPEAFRAVQWTRLPGGDTPPDFVERIKRLLSPELSPLSAASGATLAVRAPARATWRAKRVLLAIVVLVCAALAYLLANKFWLAKHGSEVTAATTKPDVTLAKSIAVLPFTDLSENRDQEYFADGLADEVLSLLATLPDLKVISRTSSFQFKGKTADLRTVGRQLGAAYVVEGSVRRSQDRVRVTAQLISTQDGAHRWSDSYERSLGDVFRLQQDIAASLGRALQVEVSGLAEEGALTHPEAYTVYLHGLHAMDRFDEAGLEESVSYFEQALAMEPSLLRARENLARARYYQYVFGFVAPRTAAERMRRVVDDVLRANPRSATAHALRAELLISYDWDWAAAQREAELAVSLAKNNSMALYAAADVASVLSRWEEAETLFGQALAVDPLDPDTRNLLGWTLYREGKFKAAELEGRRVIEIRPTYATARIYLGVVLLAQGKAQAALDEMQRELYDPARPLGLAMALSALGRKAESNIQLRAAEHDAAEQFAYWIAGAHALRGETDDAFLWLDRAYVQKDVLLEYINSDPIFKNLMGDSRYKAFLRKMNLPG